MAAVSPHVAFFVEANGAGSCRICKIRSYFFYIIFLQVSFIKLIEPRPLAGFLPLDSPPATTSRTNKHGTAYTGNGKEYYNQRNSYVLSLGLNGHLTNIIGIVSRCGQRTTNVDTCVR